MEMNIALAPDDNYAKHAACVMRSASANAAQGGSVNFWILDGGLSEASKALLSGAAERVNFIKIDAEMFAGFPSHGYITVSTWYRFAIASLMPADVSRVLYLDCDVAVASGLEELFETNLDGFAVAAVKDCIWKKFDRRAGLAPSHHYFNAGVLLVNLDYWRKNGVQKRLMDFLGGSAERMKMMDQTVLNIVLKDEYKELPLCWNVQYVPPFLEECCYGRAEIRAAMKAPKIIHYVNVFKPWSETLGRFNPLAGYFTAFMEKPPRPAGCAALTFARLLLKKAVRKPLFFLRGDYFNNIRIHLF